MPTKQTMPTQGGGSQPASNYYPTTKQQKKIPKHHRTPIKHHGKRPVTTKSQYNALAELPAKP